jgi:glucosamine--fructose-6-phosphate aminotransferase (isomerizing)
MCGIVSYVGKNQAMPILLEGLRQLEYRGYDSAGLVVRNKRQLHCVKAVGKIAELEKKVNGNGHKLSGQSGIAHTRWATHGEPTEANAHPHCDGEKKVFVVHNGIIENYKHLKDKLKELGVIFSSDTDTEVLAHLIARNFEGDLVGAVSKTMGQVEGTFGLAVVHKSVPGEIVVARRGSPLVIGIAKDGFFAASDTKAMIRHTNKVIHLNDNELARLTAGEFKIITVHAQEVLREAETVDYAPEDTEKNGFPHFMLKEIFEQPETIRNAMRGRLDIGESIAKLGGLEPVWHDLEKCHHLIIVACGTSYYAGLVARYIFEKLTDITMDVEIASEFRYRHLRFGPNTFVIALSQSGETADTIAAMREAKRKGARILGIVNVVGSTIARETEAGVFNHAGPEIGVASTKNFVSQLTILILIALLLGRHKGLSLTEGTDIIRALEAMPGQVEKVLSQANHIQAIAQKYYHCGNWLFLGRKFNYPIALEGALKLKEISYIHAEGYPAGEMKHGPIALVNPDMPTVAIIPRDDMYEKMLSNIHEIRSRKGSVIAIATEGDVEVKELAHEIIYIPQSLDFLTPVLSVVACQLLAYYCADFLGRDIDKPRNLAKSVTVE